MLLRRASDIRPSEITGERLYYSRRAFIRAAGAGLVALGGGLALSDRRYALAARKEREAREAVKKAAEVPATVAARTESV